MSGASRHENDEAAAHAEFFATHGFADIAATVDRPHGTPATGHARSSSFGRAPHGSVRAILLWALAEKPMHGYQIMTELEQRSGGFWRLSSGSVYPTLQQLADEGLVTAETEEARRVYALTDAGRAIAETIRESHGSEPWAAAKGVGERRFQLWRALSDVVEATRTAALEGTEAQGIEALVVLQSAGTQIRALLREDADAHA